MKVPPRMKAALLTRHGGPDVLELAEVDTPTPGPGEVLVRVEAAALNNTDVWTREGAYGAPGPPSGWRGSIDFPRIPGADAAGRIVACGSGVDAALVGRSVVIDPSTYDGDSAEALPFVIMGSERDGAYAQYVTAPVERVHDMTSSPLSLDELAALPIAYGTAFGMIERAGLRAGETALISGASGGVGLAAVQLAHARGARVVAVSSAGKTDAVRSAGADVVIDRTASGGIAERVPDGVDVGLDVVAGSFLEDGLALLRDGGRWAVAGALSGYQITLDVRDLYLRNIRLIGSTMNTPAHFAALMDLARSGEVRPVIAATYPLRDAAAAQIALEQRAHVGKIVLHPHRD
ncbi:zinc-binding dehydrogenase [Microbacterium koreense]|uniref:Zinc-binding dehydrogenase n=1 Tax=Microbacterium koreense TaxID=323761 RepID=A0ABW2ZPJ2_9MICO